MALPLFLPGKYFFYPIGNTAAVCLTRDIPVDVSANILLLPCGDPRNVLYTIACEPRNIRRQLDFTCCDYDPGVLARNVLLLSMIMDGIPDQTTWNIFFHIFLDRDSHAVLVPQCQKLVHSAQTLQEWRSSPYGTVIRIASEHTLNELRRHWELYVLFNGNKPSDCDQARRPLVDAARKKMLGYASDGINYSSTRSCGPLSLEATKSHLYAKQSANFWRTGTTLSDSKLIDKATWPNPTFFYSRAGQDFNVHYGTDPMIPFHLAPLFANARRELTMQDLVGAAQAEFHEWTRAFRQAVGTTQSPTVRFLLGDAIAAARVLLGCFDRETFRSLGIAVAAWTSQALELDQDEYSTFHAPTRFDVIDTSNLSDHVGLLNIFLSSVPLLSDPSFSPVLYTESLLSYETGSGSTTEFHSMLFADLSTVALLLNIAPIDALSGFATRSNMHELLSVAMSDAMSSSTQQYHQIFTWKRPQSCISTCHNSAPITFNAQQLAQLMHNVYLRLFADNDTMQMSPTRKHAETAILRSSILVYTREAFAVLLRFLRSRLQISDAEWSEVMVLFLEQHHKTASLLEPACHRDLHVQLFRYRLYVYPGLDPVAKPIRGRLSHWLHIPPLTRIYLTLPQSLSSTFVDLIEKVPTPFLQCCVRSPQDGIGEHIFQSVDIAFGQVVDEGTESRPRVSILEARSRELGSSPLVASFTIPSRLLTTAIDPSSVVIALGVRVNVRHVVSLMRVLGPSLLIFSAPFEDTQHVHVTPDEPLSSSFLSLMRSAPDAMIQESPTASAPIGLCRPIQVGLDVDHRRVASLTAKLEVESIQGKEALTHGAVPTIIQISPFAVRILLGKCGQDLMYPLPVAGSRHKLRIARKSSYIELVAPVTMSFPGLDIPQFSLFPVTRSGNYLAPWNIHRISLDHLPVVEQVSSWYNPHISFQMSVRERALRTELDHSDVLTNIKDTIHAIMVQAMGAEGNATARVFALRDDNTGDCDTIVFISSVRFDLSSHTLVCDGSVLPLTTSVMDNIEASLRRLVVGMMNIKLYGQELRAWKQLLPALVERCRMGWTHGANCEYIAKGRIPLELEISEGDPLCSCGRGKNVDGMLRGGKLWKKFAPFVTRIAISPLFAVSYLEPVLDNDMYRLEGQLSVQAGSCEKCGSERGKDSDMELRRCSRCKSVVYCSERCQKEDWKKHKRSCVA